MKPEIASQPRLEASYRALCDSIAQLDGAVVAFSGGVDSTLVLAAAHDALGDRALGVIGVSPSYPAAERRAARILAGRIGARFVEVETDEFSCGDYTSNPPERCFHCKDALFRAATPVAREQGLAAVLEGSNLDDLGDYRPGLQAVQQHAVRSPLMDQGIGKEQVRALAHHRGLDNWDKPALACLASRVPYGQAITPERLARIERAEACLRALGIPQLRVRDHDELARIEVPPDLLAQLVAEPLRGQVLEGLKQAGYTWVSLDLRGYRTGAMNEALPREPGEGA